MNMLRSLVKQTSMVLGVLVMVFPLLTYAEDASAREYKIKAAYLFKLIKFVNWPKKKSEAGTSTRICVYGHNPFAAHLDKLSKLTAKGKPINVSYINEQNQIPNCDIAFIASTNPDKRAVLSSNRLEPVLTVGESTTFLDEGGIISLVVENNNVQLQVNLMQAKKVGFEISGNLLEIAKIVR